MRNADISDPVKSAVVKTKYCRILLYVRSIILILTIMPVGCVRYKLINILQDRHYAGVNLSGIDLYYRNLEKIDLERARLFRSNLSFSVLRNARMANADLHEADLSAADLTGADLRGANCRKANLENAILRKANLTDCYFYDANLRGADLRESILATGIGNYTDYITLQNRINRGENIYFTHLRNADLAGAVISMRWKKFIGEQNVVNYDKILWVK